MHPQSPTFGAEASHGTHSGDSSQGCWVLMTQQSVRVRGTGECGVPYNWRACCSWDGKFATSKLELWEPEVFQPLFRLCHARRIHILVACVSEFLAL